MLVKSGIPVRERFLSAFFFNVRSDVMADSDTVYALHVQGEREDIKICTCYAQASDYLQFVTKVEKEVQTHGVALVLSSDRIDEQWHDNLFIVCSED